MYVIESVHGTEFDKIFSAQHPRQMVERRVNQRFEDHLCLRHQGSISKTCPLHDIQLSVVAGGDTRGSSDGVKYLLCSALLYPPPTVISIGVTGDQDWLSVKTLSFLKLFLFSRQ
jgi:hypothetical protein